MKLMVVDSRGVSLDIRYRLVRLVGEIDGGKQDGVVLVAVTATATAAARLLLLVRARVVAANGCGE